MKTWIDRNLTGVFLAGVAAGFGIGGAVVILVFAVGGVV